MKGVGELIRLILRRERVVLPMWILVFGLIPAGIAGGFEALFPTEAQIREGAEMMAANPAFVAFLGEVYAPTLGGLTAWRSMAPLALGVGIVSVLAVVRHTRAEEQSGRRELIASTVLGRHAPLVAALAVVGVADLAIGALSAGALIGYGLEPAGSLALGAALAASGWMFSALAVLAAQLAESSRTANGMGLGAVGVAFLLRVVGDAGAGTGLEALSWISPIGLAQRVRPYADERMWVLGVLVLAALAVTAAAQSISRRRDVGAGLISTRPGSPTASPTLGGSFGLAFRLQRGVALAWVVGFVVFGGLIGLITDSFVSLMLETPALAQIIAAVGSADLISDAFLGSMLALFGIVAAAHGVQAVLWLRSEEVEGRAESVLSTRVPRTKWMSSHLGLGLLVPVVDLVAAGSAAGFAHGLTIDDLGQTGRLATAALVALPAAWLLVGVAVSLFGFAAHLSRLALTIVGIAGLLTLLGRAVGLEQWVLDLSPFTHTPPMPGGELTLTPLAWMTALAAAFIAAAYWGFNRRDVEGV